MEATAESRGEGVRWHAWEPEALERAATEGKLIFLDIGAAWCHWCHVLDRTSLSDPRVVRILNEDFVSVRVDTDQRPDINDRYNQGGWPTVAVLLPDGRLLTGATYLPPDALVGVLVKCRDFYRRDRDRIDGLLAGGEAPADEPATLRMSAPPEPRPEDLPLVEHSVLSAYDPVHHGFFREPKFPVPEILAFLRDSWLMEGNGEAGEIFLKVLGTMGTSGLFDAVEGGFFRYAARLDWTGPHYEKLLSDNAALLSLYASAYGRTRDASFAGTARGILRFLFDKLHDSATGAFFGSQDADETYYPLPAPERARRFPPAVDRTFFSEYNGRMISALVASHRAFGDPVGAGAGSDTLLARAERLARFLRRSLWRGPEGLARYQERPGFPDPPLGLLADHAAVACGFLDLFDATGNFEHLGFAEEVLSFAVDRLYREAAAGFLDRRPSAGDFGNLSVGRYPFAPNADAASALLRFARAAGDASLFRIAVRTLCGLSTESDKRGAFSAPYGSALMLYRKGSPGKGCIPGDPACTPPPTRGLEGG